MLKMIKAATCTQLQKLLQSHWKETASHVRTLEKVFRSFGEKPRAKKCEATIGLLKEGDEVASDNKAWPVLNAALISVAQKLEHYEIATYGCLHGWARLLGNTEAAGLLQEILVEQRRQIMRSASWRVPAAMKRRSVNVLRQISAVMARTQSH